LVEVAVVQGEGEQMALVVGIEWMYYNSDYVNIAWGVRIRCSFFGIANPEEQGLHLD